MDGKVLFVLVGSLSNELEDKRMKQNSNEPQIEVGNQVKIFDHNGKLLHEGLTVAAPNSPTPFRNDGNGLWTYFFQNLNGGITVATPHSIVFLDGTTLKASANTQFQPVSQDQQATL